MGWLPGWDSAESAGWWSSFHFWFGIACLFLLGGSEVLSHFYALRREELVTIADGAASRQRDQSQRETEERRAKESADLQSKVTVAEKALARLRAEQTPRELGTQEAAALTAACVPFRGQKFTATSIMSDDEGARFLDQIVAAIDAAGWDHGGGDGIGEVVERTVPDAVAIGHASDPDQQNQR